MNELFKNIFVFQPKSKRQASEGLDVGVFPFYTSSSRQKKFIDTKVYDGEAIILGTGGLPNVHFEAGSFSTSTDCLVAKLRDEAPYSIKFAYYYLFGNIHVLAKGFKGAGLKHISKKYIEEIEIPKLTIEEQNNYVSYFDKIQSLINKRLLMVDLLDEYLESQFFSLFGQDYDNTKLWKWSPLRELLNDIKSGWSPVCENYPRKDGNEWAVLKQGAVTRGEFAPDENKFLSSDIVKGKETVTTANKLDLLFSRKNTKDLVGSSVFVYTDYDKLLIPDTIFKLDYLPNKISGVYLASLFNDYNFRKKLRKLASGSASSMVNISQAKLLALEIPVPQNTTMLYSFERLAFQVYAQKERLRKSLELLEELFKTLIYAAFNSSTQKIIDDIDSLIMDDIEIEIFLNTVNSGDFDNEERYKMDIDKLYKILERTEKRNQADPSFRKGIIQRLNNGRIVIELNKEFKNRLIDEAATT